MTIAGRVEAQMTVPAGISISATNSGGTTAVSLTAGTYYPTDFAAHVQARLNAVRTPATWTVTLDTTTGQVTINWTGTGNYSIAFTSGEVRVALGLTSSIGTTAAGTPVTGAHQAVGLWIPQCPLVADVDSRAAPTETDMRDSESPTGYVYSIGGVDRYAHTGLKWEDVAVNRVWAFAETLVGQSYETFFADAIRGNGNTWFGLKRPLRIYDHNGSQLGQSKSISAWTLSGVPDLAKLRMPINRYTGLVTIEWPRLVSAG